MFRINDYNDYSDSEDSANLTSDEIQEFELEKYNDILNKVLLFRNYLAEYPDYNAIKSVYPGEIYHLMEYSMNSTDEDLERSSNFAIEENIAKLFEEFYKVIFIFSGSLVKYKFVLNQIFRRVYV